MLSPTGTHARLYALAADAVLYLSANAQLQTSHLLRREHLSYQTTSLLRGSHAYETSKEPVNFQELAQANDVTGKIKFIIGVVKQWQLDAVLTKSDSGGNDHDAQGKGQLVGKGTLETWKEIKWKGVQEAMKEKDMRWTVVGRYAGSLK